MPGNDCPCLFSVSPASPLSCFISVLLHVWLTCEVLVPHHPVNLSLCHSWGFTASHADFMSLLSL